MRQASWTHKSEMKKFCCLRQVLTEGCSEKLPCPSGQPKEVMSKKRRAEITSKARENCSPHWGTWVICRPKNVETLAEWPTNTSLSAL